SGVTLSGGVPRVIIASGTSSASFNFCAQRAQQNFTITAADENPLANTGFPDATQTDSVVAASAAQLTFATADGGQQPTNTASMRSISNSSPNLFGGVKVAVEDVFGNVATGSTLPVTVQFDFDPTFTATLRNSSSPCPCTVNASSGIATFSSLTIDKTGSAF